MTFVLYSELVSRPGVKVDATIKEPATSLAYEYVGIPSLFLLQLLW